MQTKGGAPCTVSNTSSRLGSHCSTSGGGRASSGLTAFASGDGSPLVDLAALDRWARDRVIARGGQPTDEAVLVEHIGMVQAMIAAMSGAGVTVDPMGVR